MFNSSSLISNAFKINVLSFLLIGSLIFKMVFIGQKLLSNNTIKVLLFKFYIGNNLSNLKASYCVLKTFSIGFIKSLIICSPAESSIKATKI